MSAIYLYDDERARCFEPFALTRPVSELAAGVAVIRDRWVTALQLPAGGAIVAPHLADFDEPLASAAVGDRIPAHTVIANARFAPMLRSPQFDRVAPGLAERDTDPGADRWMSNGRVAAVRIGVELRIAELRDGALPLDDIRPSGTRTVEIEGWWLEEVWDFVRLLPEQLAADIAHLHRAPSGSVNAAVTRPPTHATVVGSFSVLVSSNLVVGGEVIQQGATIEPHVVFDVTRGPIYVGPESVVHAFTRLVGPCYVGRGSTVLGDRVAASSIGDHCKVRGELSNTVVLGYANKGHEGFVGHSYLGRWVNLGASTVTSNLKNTYGSVTLWTPAGVRNTGMQFLGTFFGDHAKTGIGLRLTTGTVLGAGANVYGGLLPPKAVPPFSWGDSPPYDRYRLDKFLEVAERAMARRRVTLGDRGRRLLAAAYAAGVSESPRS